MKNRLFALVIALCSVLAASAQSNATAETELAYTRTLEERAEKIVVPLHLTNIVAAQQVRDAIVRQCRALREIHEERDASLKAVQASVSDEADVEAAAAPIREKAKARMDRRHAEFLKELSASLTSEQVEQVKDGMTYGVVNVTMGAYLKMFPDLSEEQKAQIKAWLVEAREIAMDQGTSREKHEVFGKYKGRINNYLSKAGYDLKKGEHNLRK